MQQKMIGLTFVVADCSFSDTRKMLKYRLNTDFKMPSFTLLNIASFINKLILGVHYKDISPMEAAKKIKAPTMIIHGELDTYTPYIHGHDIYDNLVCEKSFYSAKDAKHAKSFAQDKDKYEEEVKNFLSSIGY